MPSAYDVSLVLTAVADVADVVGSGIVDWTSASAAADDSVAALASVVATAGADSGSGGGVLRNSSTRRCSLRARTMPVSCGSSDLRRMNGLSGWIGVRDEACELMRFCEGRTETWGRDTRAERAQTRFTVTGGICCLLVGWMWKRCLDGRHATLIHTHTLTKMRMMRDEIKAHTESYVLSR